MMNIRTVLFVRAAILIIIGVGVLVSSLYNGSHEPEPNQEKTVMKIILLATSMVITGIAISNIVFAFFPKMETQSLTLASHSQKLLFETPCTFENDEDAIFLSVPADVIRNRLTDGLIEGARYTVTYERRSRVVSDIRLSESQLE